MEISIITQAGHGGYGGIALYNTYFSETLAFSNKISKINIYSRSLIKKKQKKTTVFQVANKFFFFIVVNLKIFNLLKSKIIFVTHFNLLPSAIIPLLLGKKIVLLTYGLEIWGNKKNLINSYLIKKIKYFICMRHYTFNVMKKKYKIKNFKYYLLPNCIKLNHLKMYRSKKINRTKKINLVTVARLDSQEKYKGVDETLEALSLFKSINFNYFIIGDGTDKDRLKKKTQDLKLSKYVKFYGKISNYSRDKILKNSSIMMMPGSDKTFDTYPFRFSFLEAARFGIKIISSYPANDELKYESYYKTFYFVNPKNRKDIFNKIKLLQKRNNKIYDRKLLNDFSYSIYKSNLIRILDQIMK